MSTDTMVSRARRQEIGAERVGSEEDPRPNRVLLPANLSPVDWLLLLGPFAVGIVLTFANTPDDVLITMRYAANVVHGNGPTFNPGERVEGFTSPLHLAVAVAVYLLPGGFVLAKAKAVSVVFGGLAVWTGARLLRVADLGTVPFRVGLVLLGASPMVVWAAVSGMETTLACWLLSLLLLVLVSGCQVSRWVLAGAVAGALVLTRPEAALVVAGLAIVSMVLGRPWPVWHRLRWAALAGGILVLSEAVRLAYFREPLPNTFYAKSTAKSLGTFKAGIAYVLSAFVPQDTEHRGRVVTFGLALLIVVLIGVGTVVILRRRRALAYLPVAGALVAGFAVFQGGDWMLIGRFVAPVAPALVVVEMVAFEQCLAWARRVPVRGAVTVVAAVGAIGLILTTVGLRYVSSTPVWLVGGDFSDRELLVHSRNEFATVWVAGSGMLSCAQPGDLVGYTEMGHAGFEHLDVRFIDGRGLVDREIAKASSPETKTSVGTVDRQWRDPTSPVGRVYMDRKPELILSIDGPPEPDALDGLYLLERHEQIDGVDLMLYRRTDVTCASA